jgi:hypothetical protein
MELPNIEDKVYFKGNGMVGMIGELCLYQVLYRVKIVCLIF